jgi:RHS repeat-associated protein
VTDFKGLEYERIEYTPYGELWVEKTIAGSERLPFRFTGKEFDEETGLYYYGARYLDPKVSRWLSTDPAVGEYIPSAPVNDEARRRNGNLPGMGGIYNLVNFHLYHYAGNNPVRYIDPDGREILPQFAFWNMSVYKRIHTGNSETELFNNSGCYPTAFADAKATQEFYKFLLSQTNVSSPLAFFRSMTSAMMINNMKDLFAENSACWKSREAMLDGIFGKGNWDYWTKKNQGTEGLLAKLKEYRDSNEKFIVLGIFDLSTANPDVINHMLGIDGTPGDDGVFDPGMLTPSSNGDRQRLSNIIMRLAYNIDNLKEIIIIKVDF